MSHNESLSEQITFFEDIIHGINEAQGDFDGSKESGKGILPTVNQYALEHPNMVIQLLEAFENGIQATKTFRSKDFMRYFPGTQRVIDRTLWVLTPLEAAAIAPWGFTDGNDYCGAGEALAFGPEGLEECVAKDEFVAFCTEHSTTGQFVHDVMSNWFDITGQVTKSFKIAKYLGVHGGRFRAKYSAVYLSKGYTFGDLFKELNYLLAVYARPA